MNRIGSSVLTGRKCADAAKRSRFDGVGIVLAAVFELPSAGRKGRQKPSALNLSTGCIAKVSTGLQRMC